MVLEILDTRQIQIMKYQTHQVMTNKNSLTEINRHRLKIEKTHPEIHRANTNTRRKKHYLENLKRIMNEKKNKQKNYRTITKKQNTE